MKPSQAPPGPDATHGGIVSVVATYAVFAALWILLSDNLVAWLFASPLAITIASTLKGWAFVVVTSLLLYSLLRRRSPPRDAPPSGGRAAYWVIGLVLLAIAGVGAIAVRNLVRHHEAQVVAQLRAIANLKADQIVSWLDERRRDADQTRTAILLNRALRDWVRRGDAASRDAVLQRLETVRRIMGYQAVFAVDAGGGTLLGAGDHHPLASAARPVLERALTSGETQFSDFYRDAEGRLCLDYIAPLPAVAGEAGFALVLRVDQNAFLLPFLRAQAVPSATGETLLIRRDGDTVVYLNTLRHRPEEALALRIPMADGELLAAQRVSGRAGPDQLIVGVDYRGVPAVGVAHDIDGTAWHLIAKMDQNEINGQIGRDLLWVGLALTLAICVALAGGLLMRQRERLAAADALRKAQQARLDAIDLLGTIADSSDDAIFAKDTAGRYLLFNHAASRLIGRPASEVIGRDDRALFPPEYAEKVVAFGRRLLAEGITVTEEDSVDTPAGRRVLLGTGGPLRDRDGEIVGTYGIARDITERKRMEDALRASEERMRLLFEHAPAALAMFDRDMCYLAASRRWLRDFGLAGREVIGCSHYDLFPEINEALKAIHRRGLAGETVAGDEDRFTRTDGSLQWLRWEMRPWRQTDGAIGGIVLFSEDITERKTAEIRLRESERRFHDIVEASADWIWEFDDSGRYTYASENVEALLGYPPAEVVGKTPFDFMPPAEAGRGRQALQAIIGHQAPFRDLDNVFLRKDGGQRHVLSTGLPIRGLDGTLLGYRGLDRDITDRKLAELALRDNEARFRALFDHLAVAVIIHDRDSGTPVEANRSALNLYGAATFEQLRDHARWLPAPHGRDDMARWVRRAATEGRQHLEWRSLARDGREFWQDIRLDSMTLGGVARVLSIGADITERKRTEAELRLRNEELERFNRATIGRELDMIGMKIQINALSRELGRAAPYRLDFLEGSAGEDAP